MENKPNGQHFKNILIGTLGFFIFFKCCSYLMDDGPQKTVNTIAKEAEGGVITPKNTIRHYSDAYDLLNNPTPSDGKEITVNGIVNDVSEDGNGGVFVLLKGYDGQEAMYKYIEAYISPYSSTRPEDLIKGKETQLQGTCGSVYKGNVIMIGCKINPL